MHSSPYSLKNNYQNQQMFRDISLVKYISHICKMRHVKSVAHDNKRTIVNFFVKFLKNVYCGFEKQQFLEMKFQY